MNRTLALLAVIEACVIAMPVNANTEDATAAVPFKLWVSGYVPPPANPDPNNLQNGVTVDVPVIWPDPVGQDFDTKVGLYPFTSSTVVEPLKHLEGDFRVIPGRSYQVLVGTGNVQNASLNIAAPPGYRVFIDGIARPRVTYSGDWVFHFQIDPVSDAGMGANAAAREFLSSATVTTAIDWEMSLGSLHNGASAGKLTLADTGTRSDWTPLYTPAALSYESPSDEVYVYRVNDIIQQIVADQIAVDIVTLSATSYEIRCYNPGQITNSSAPFTFSGSPFLTYRVQQGASATSLVLTKEVRDITDLISTFPVVRSETMKIDRTSTGTSSSDFTWSRQGWMPTGQYPLTVTSTQSADQGNNTRSESIVVQNYGLGGGAPALNLTRSYAVLPNLGEVVTSETLGSTNQKTTTFDYYSDPNYINLGLLRSATLPGGTWVAYDYQDCDAPATFSSHAGLPKYEYRPFQNWPASPTHDTTQGSVIHYEYTTDESGGQTWPALVEKFVSGIQAAKTTYSYAFNIGAPNGQSITQTTRTDYSSSSASLTTVVKTYRTDLATSLYRGQPYSTTAPDGSQHDFAYETGTWDGSTFTSGSGAASRITELVGSSNSAAGTLQQTWNGQQIDSVYLVSGKSTAETTIRDSRALIARTESRRWDGAQWVLVGWKNYSYDLAGNLVLRSASNGATDSATFEVDRKTSETDVNGVTTNLSYDAAGRIASKTRQNAGPIPAATTSYTYDAADRITRETIAAGLGAQIVTARTFDDAGRLTSETPPGLGTTTHTYDVTSRTHTVTRPDGSTIVETRNLDGELTSKTGTAVVPEYYAYNVISSGQFSGYMVRQATLGFDGSPRWRKATADWLGRAYQLEHPGFAGGSSYLETHLYDGQNSLGHEWKMLKTGSGATLYQYDALGNLFRAGLDVNQNDSLDLASSDRINESSTYLESYNSALWLRTDTITYPTANSSAPVTTLTTRKRLTGFTTNQISELQTIDSDGVLTDESMVVDRNAQTGTSTQTRTGLSGTLTTHYAGGLPVSTTTYDGLTTSTSFDGFLRTYSTTDSRGNTTTTSYVTGTAMPSAVTDASGAQTTFHYDTSGRKDWERDAGGHYTRYEYNARSALVHQWGDAALPAEYGYDTTYGNRTSMSTFRAGSGWEGTAWPSTTGSADTTTWTYDAGSGFLASKTDAQNHTVARTYCSCGKISSQTDGRGVTITYGYDWITGEMTNVGYSDGTPTLTYTYDRMGRIASVIDATGTRTFSYDATHINRLASENYSGFYNNRVFTPLYEQGLGLVMPGRLHGFKLGSGFDSNSDLEQDFGYTAQGRFLTITTARSSNAASRTFRYAYLTNAAFVSGVSIDGGSPFSVSRTYDAQRDLVSSVKTMWSTSTRSEFDFQYNALRQRTSVTQSGDAFADYGEATHRTFQYDSRGELTADQAYLGSSTTDQSRPLPGRVFQYAYENAGNRLWANHTGTTGTEENYSTNALNQVVSKENNSVAVTGETDAANAVTVDNAPATRQGNFYDGEVLPPTTSAPANYNLTVSITPPGQATSTYPYAVLNLPSPQSFTYDANGNLMSDGLWNYSWDGENRPIRMTTTSAAAANGVSNWEIDLTYDYLGRRVQKRVIDLASMSELSSRRYLYDGWNLIAEFDAPGGSSTGTLVRSYTWGLDILHSLNSAGGVAALLQVADHATGRTFLPTYDANGNVASLLNADTGAVAAAYEYSPYGELLRAQTFDSVVTNQPFRFSTKFTDVETGLIYYGYRYYSPTLGRFISRDPIEESGGINLYGFVSNDPVDRWDYLGHATGDDEKKVNNKGYDTSAVDMGGGDWMFTDHTSSGDHTYVQHDPSYTGGLTASGASMGGASFGGTATMGGEGGGSTTGTANANSKGDCNGDSGNAAISQAATDNQTSPAVPAQPQGPQAGSSQTPDATTNGGPNSTAAIVAGGMVTTVPGILPTSTGGVLSTIGGWITRTALPAIADGASSILAPVGALLLLTPTSTGSHDTLEPYINPKTGEWIDPATGRAVTNIWSASPTPAGAPPYSLPGGVTWVQKGQQRDGVPSWIPSSPIPSLSGGQPSASWDGEGHWDVDLGNGTRLRLDWRGNQLTAEQAHNPNAPKAPNNNPDCKK